MKELCFIKVTLFYPLIAAGMASVFGLETKGTKSSIKNEASALEAILLARRSFVPPHGYCISLVINIH